MASTILVNTIDTQSGSTISIPTGKTLAIVDAGALTIGGTAITTGAQGVISKTATYPIVAGDFTGKSSLIVFVDASAGTSTEIAITLPAAADFSTCAIHVVSTATHGAGNSVAIKLGAVEQYTLYAKHDHCEFVSDGTNTIRTGNEWVTVNGFIFRNVNEGVTQGATEVIFQASEFTEREDVGGWWNSTTFAAEVPWDCKVYVQALIFNQDSGGYLQPSIKRYYSSRASNEWIYRTDNRTGNMLGHMPPCTFFYDFSAGDEIEWSAYNTHSTATMNMAGSTDGWRSGCYAKWNVVRRY